ncbi:ATP-binding cassette domain-containing protein [Loktanella sp. R86503]|uniref:thiamine ABC transporter ATP-binding protein n=1 Tax=Loktanella sp. R86503 TaxID=3093847 RepID=UPI0036DD6FC8
MLTLDDVTVAKGTFRLQANIAVPPGMTAVIGPSGGGKSTLLSAIAGFEPAVSGRIKWGDVDLSEQAPGQRPVTMLFQDNNLFPHLTTAQNVGLALAPRLKLSQPQLMRVEAALEDVGLPGLGGRKPSALSGGQIGRAALARSLLSDRPVVLLDEAFAALGPALRAEMLALVRDRMAQQGRTVIMVTHDPDDARNFADYVIFVAEGIAHPPQKARAFFTDPSPAAQSYLG